MGTFGMKRGNLSQVDEIDIVDLASAINLAYDTRDISRTKALCSLLYNEVSPRKRGGRALLGLSAEDCQCVGLAFTTMALRFDWGDEDINSVAAENAYYCLGRSLVETDNTFVAPAIFCILLIKPQYLRDKLIASFCSLLAKEGSLQQVLSYRNPYKDPSLNDFREQALSFKTVIMYYALTQFYDIDKNEYLIPLDLPYYIPTEEVILSFISRIKSIKTQNEEKFSKVSKVHFMSLLKACTQALERF